MKDQKTIEEKIEHLKYDINYNKKQNVLLEEGIKWLKWFLE